MYKTIFRLFGYRITFSLPKYQNEFIYPSKIQIKDLSDCRYKTSLFYSFLQNLKVQLRQIIFYRCVIILREDKFGNMRNFVRVQLYFNRTKTLSNVKEELLKKTKLPKKIINQLQKGNDLNNKPTFFWEIGILVHDGGVDFAPPNSHF